MIKQRRLKTGLISFQAILGFVLSRKDINIYNDITRRHGSVTNKYFWKYEKLKQKQISIETRHWLSQQLQTTWCGFEIPDL